MNKKTSLKIREINCLNCGFPFNGQENFCPECGQKNKGSELTFINFINEIFAGFFSWDAKFWKTIIPLLTKPGKVSLDYVTGKRNRYTNPFRFYLTVSVLFFLLNSLSNAYDDFKELNKPAVLNKKEEVKKDSTLSNTTHRKPSIITDSIKEKNANSFLTLQKKPKVTKAKIGGFNLAPFIKFQKKHPKLKTDLALDSLHAEKTFINRFMYQRAAAINGLTSKKEEGQKFANEILSKISIALFVLLPIFALFLKLIYIRRKKTYVAHLVFTFHTQTVFFLLLTFVLLISFVKEVTDTVLSVFILLFLLYLFLAMKKFYQQRTFKTFIKFILANLFFMFLSVLGITIVSAIALLLF